jgi:hypothetical protein
MLLGALLAWVVGMGCAPTAVEPPRQLDYFRVGEWTLGMDEAAARALLSEPEPDPTDGCRAGLAASFLGGRVPTCFSFEAGRLASAYQVLYEGPDRAAAGGVLRALVGALSREFGGAMLGGYTTTEGLDEENAELIVDSVLKAVARSLSSERAATVVLWVSTEYEARRNYLYAQFRYESDAPAYVIELWDDPDFVEARLPRTDVVFRRPRNRPPSSP